jgi:hypothetical protein
MSFDLYVFPVDKAMSDRAASRHVMRLQDADLDPDAPPGAELAGFLADFRARYPDLHALDEDSIEADQIPVLVDAYSSHAFLSIWWSAVAEVAAFALELTERHGLALFDPQAEVVHLPPALGPRRPTDWDAAQAEGQAMIDVFTDVMETTPLTGDPKADIAASMRRMVASGMRMTDICGNELTVDNVGEVFDRPPRLPAQLQTPKHRARLFADLGAANPMKRSGAVLRASAWDPDPEITAALRRILADDPDHGVRSMAALGLGTMRDLESFPQILGLVRELAERGDWHALDDALSAARAMTDLAPLVDGPAVADARAMLERLAAASASVGSRQGVEFDHMRRELNAAG